MKGITPIVKTNSPMIICITYLLEVINSFLLLKKIIQSNLILIQIKLKMADFLNIPTENMIFPTLH